MIIIISRNARKNAYAAKNKGLHITLNIIIITNSRSPLYLSASRKPPRPHKTAPEAPPIIIYITVHIIGNIKRGGAHIGSIRKLYVLLLPPSRYVSTELSMPHSSVTADPAITAFLLMRLKSDFICPYIPLRIKNHPINIYEVICNIIHLFNDSALFIRPENIRLRTVFRLQAALFYRLYLFYRCRFLYRCRCLLIHHHLRLRFRPVSPAVYCNASSNSG
jgi:hypothetical protein